MHKARTYDVFPIPSLFEFDQTENSAIRSADPENPSLEPDMDCIGFTAIYSPLNYTVTLKLGFGSLKIIESGIDRAHTTLYSSSICKICLYLLPFPRYSRILVENRCPPCIRRPR